MYRLVESSQNRRRAEQKIQKRVTSNLLATVLARVIFIYLKIVLLVDPEHVFNQLRSGKSVLCSAHFRIICLLYRTRRAPLLNLPIYQRGTLNLNLTAVQAVNGDEATVYLLKQAILVVKI